MLEKHETSVARDRSALQVAIDGIRKVLSECSVGVNELRGKLDPLIVEGPTPCVGGNVDEKDRGRPVQRACRMAEDLSSLHQEAIQLQNQIVALHHHIQI